MTNSQAQLLLIDCQDFSSVLLQEELQRKGFSRIVRHDLQGDIQGALDGFEPDAVIFNYHYDHRQSLAACARIKQLAPDVPVVALASAGPAMRHVGAWARETKQIDVVIEKPLSDERFFLVLSNLVAARRSAREQQVRLSRLSNLVPEAALAALSQPEPGKAEMFEATILFTDIRRSTEMIASLRPEEYFTLLNRGLSAQTAVLEAGRGSVVKYTGDGLLAVFRGMGRTQLALRSALALAAHESQHILPYGIGLAHGLVLGGFVGDSQQAGRRSQYDVIGSTVHLAARLCSLAGAGEVITTRGLQATVRSGLPDARPVGPLTLRGFTQAVECVAFRPPSTA